MRSIIYVHGTKHCQYLTVRLSCLRILKSALVSHCKVWQLYMMITHDCSELHIHFTGSLWRLEILVEIIHLLQLALIKQLN